MVKIGGTRRWLPPSVRVVSTNAEGNTGTSAKRLLVLIYPDNIIILICTVVTKDLMKKYYDNETLVNGIINQKVPWLYGEHVCDTGYTGLCFLRKPMAYGNLILKFRTVPFVTAPTHTYINVDRMC